ncbi:hypothetical protein MUP07_04720, partial [Candidatus Bathyarchaeota archaeon]|nr:hypothetical protein [Candidatus Bathyarchaeota archaeon]
CSTERPSCVLVRWHLIEGGTRFSAERGPKFPESGAALKRREKEAVTPDLMSLEQVALLSDKY